MADTVVRASLDTLAPALAGEFEAPRIARLKSVAYLEAVERMRAFVARRDASTADEIWLLQHPPVYTPCNASSAAARSLFMDLASWWPMR
jgi:lipoate-protein ligase B